ncbi:hypothetical protein [Glaciibacter psychrotolerans]|uniref:DUF3168 domain-containing protein n=1 Tax=Glaciibacter psychrotolerans TaxID=670054 RepID=A0A7Z0ECQ6_9MICO|nr:hypothetical protein [Leifsonia psychrotolerans]NYJ19200.1 hypothetical protein [Leifsonia psychrotolerans]
MQQHTTAIESLAKTAPAFASKTFVLVARDPVGKIPTTPYLVIYPADGADTQERNTGSNSTQHPRFTLHVVGSSYGQVATAVKQLKDRFVINGFGVEMSVPGEQSGKLWFESPLPIQVDNDINPGLAYQVLEIGWSADAL